MSTAFGFILCALAQLCRILPGGFAVFTLALSSQASKYLRSLALFAHFLSPGANHELLLGLKAEQQEYIRILTINEALSLYTWILGEEGKQYVVCGPAFVQDSHFDFNQRRVRKKIPIYVFLVAFRRRTSPVKIRGEAHCGRDPEWAIDQFGTPLHYVSELFRGFRNIKTVNIYLFRVLPPDCDR
jgi:hypothetical protein